LGQCYESGVGVSKNDQLAFEWYYRAAEATQDAEAYYRMGCMYSEERVPLPDLSMNKDMEAYKLYNLAVEASPESHGLACYELAMYNMNGITGNHQQVLMIADVCLAIEYLRTSADLNVTKSMLELALLFLNDDFPIEEQEEGFRRLAHAAELDLMEAQYELGRFYHLGKEVILVGDDTNEADDEDIDGGDEEECVVIPQNFEKAYDLFCRSAAQKHPTATYYLGLYHQHGIFVAPDLSIALEQYEIAVQLFEQCGDAPERWQAEFNLACILHHDVESRHRAYDLFQVAQLHAPEESKFLSKIMITRYHLYGWGDVSIQAEEAVSTLIQFSHDEKTGYYVFLDIAHCYETGTGVPQDLRQAFYWYGEVVGKAHLVGDNDNILDEEVEENEANAMFKLAEFYRNGWVVSKDLEKAEDLYKLAANKGSQAAQEYLSIMLQRTNIYD
jgi:TPR repeat protein